MTFSVSKLVFEWRHSIPAMRELRTDLGAGVELVLSVSKARNSRPVLKKLAFALAAVADRAILPKK